MSVGTNIFLKKNSINRVVIFLSVDFSLLIFLEKSNDLQRFVLLFKDSLTVIYATLI